MREIIEPEVWLNYQAGCDALTRAFTLAGRVHADAGRTWIAHAVLEADKAALREQLRQLLEGEPE